MKKIFSCLLTVALVFSMIPFTVNASAAKCDLSEIPMEQFFSLTDAGTIYLDEAAAREAGIELSVINFVKERLDFMNAIVRAGGAYVDSNFHIVSYPGRTRSLTGGVTKYDYAWDGSLLIYLNSDDTETLIDELNSGGSVVSGLLGFFGNVFGNLYSALNQLTITQLKAANSGNTGVVINVKPNFDTGGQDVYIWSQ